MRNKLYLQSASSPGTSFMSFLIRLLTLAKVFFKFILMVERSSRTRFLISCGRSSSTLMLSSFVCLFRSWISFSFSLRILLICYLSPRMKCSCLKHKLLLSVFETLWKPYKLSCRMNDSNREWRKFRGRTSLTKAYLSLMTISGYCQQMIFYKEASFINRKATSRIELSLEINPAIGGSLI